MDFSCFIVVILPICKIRRRCGCTKKNTQRWSVEGKSSNERRERANRCLWEQTSTWRFSSSVKSYGFLVWRSASATKISGSRSRDGVAFTRIAIECLVRTRAISAFVVFPGRFFIHILVPHRFSYLPFVYLTVSSIFLFYSLKLTTASLTILSSSNSVDDSPRLDSIAVIRWLSNQIH